MSSSTNYTILADTSADLLRSSDCDCACPAPQLPLQQPTVLLPQVRYVASSTRQCIQLNAEYAVACVPSHSRVAVLNRAAQALWQRFEHPRALYECAAAEQAAVARLVRLGLLHAENQPLEPPAPPDTLSAWLHVTNACNLHCSYCYIAKDETAMTPETAHRALDTILTAADKHGYRRIGLKFAGGEASLNLALVFEIWAAARARAAAAQIDLAGVVLSNGVALPRAQLLHLRDAGLRLMISLDGPQEAHDHQRPRLGGQGSYQAVTRTIEAARELGVNLTVSVTVTGASVAGLPAVVAWLLEREVHFSLNFYRDNDCSSDRAALAYDEQRLISGMRAAYSVIAEHPPAYSLLGCLLDRTNLGAAHARTCAVGENYLVIDPAGRIAHCQMEIQSPLTSIAAADPLAVIRLTASGVRNLPVDQKTGCRDCAWKYWCAGGCAVATYRATGRYDIQSPNCAIYQALYPEVLYLEGLRLLRNGQD